MNEAAPVAGPEKKTPNDFHAVDINWFTVQVDWPHPTWMDHDLYFAEFWSDDDTELGQRLLDAFNRLRLQIDKALAGNYADASIIFKYYRRISDNARKLRPIKLKATLYKNPNYGNVWMYVERA